MAGVLGKKNKPGRQREMPCIIISGLPAVISDNVANDYLHDLFICKYCEDLNNFMVQQRAYASLWKPNTYQTPVNLALFTWKSGSFILFIHIL